MRLIDAAALFRRISHEMDCEKLYLPVDLQEMVASEPTVDVEPTQKWISVKDRLPEVDTNVVVYAEGKNDPIYRIVITSMSDKNIFDPRIKREPYWREPWQFFDTMYEITHWMPMPEPPKEDE